MRLFDEPVPYRCLAADPPWKERGGGRIKRGADRHYPLLDAQDIVEVMRASGHWRPAADAHFWLWVTDNFLPAGLWVMETLGFRYVRTMCWAKMRGGRVQTGLGQYLRGAHELCLLGVRGHGSWSGVRTEHRDVPSLIVAPRGRHSKKPREAYEAIERVSKGPRVEFFARTPRAGWTVWGNEVAA